jgi:hypothetical protein
MGADLYIESVQDKLKKEWEPWFSKAVMVRDTLHHLGDLTTKSPAVKPISKAKAKKNVARGGELLDVDKVQETAQEMVTFFYDKMYEQGYYRDSYNLTNLLWVLNSDYWQTFAKLLDKEGYMQVPQVEEFVNWLEANKVPDFETFVKERLASESKDGWEGWFKREKPEDIHKYFVEKRVEMLTFFRQALELKEPPRCSI